MKVKLLPIIAAATAAGSTAVALAAGSAETFVTIKGKSGDFHGRVDSPQVHKCVENRLVKVFKQKGPQQQPSTDTKIASDHAALNGDWSVGNTGYKKGRFYARAPKKEGCKPGSSATITLSPPPDKAQTRVTIDGQNGDYHGFVKSPRASCLGGRTIIVFRQKGAEQQPKTDDRIGTDTSERNGVRGEWSIGNSGFKTGRFYAGAAPTASCGGGYSDTIQR